MKQQKVAEMEAAAAARVAEEDAILQAEAEASARAARPIAPTRAKPSPLRNNLALEQLLVVRTLNPQVSSMWVVGREFRL